MLHVLTRRLWFSAGPGGKYTTGMARSPAYKAWLTEGGWLLKQANPPTMPKRTPVCVVICAFMNRRRDLDNIAKPVLDLLQHAAILPNDNWVDQILLLRSETKGDHCSVRWFASQ